MEMLLDAWQAVFILAVGFLIPSALLVLAAYKTYEKFFNED